MLIFTYCYFFLDFFYNFIFVFRYVYGGRLSLETYDALDIIKILEAADELSLQELIACLQTYLVESKANWVEQNFNFINQISFNMILS